MDETAPPPPAPPSRPPRAPWLSSLASLLVPLGLSLATLAIGLWWLVSTTSGLGAAIKLTNSLSPQQIFARGIEGSLRAGARLERLEIRGADWAVEIDQLAVRPRSLLPDAGAIELETLSARRLLVDWLPTVPATAGSAPASLALPIKLLLPSVKLGEFAIGQRHSTPLLLSELSLAGEWDAQEIRVQDLAVRLDALQARAAGRMQARPPYAIQVEGSIESALAGHELAAQVKLDGRLEAMQVQARLASPGSPTRGSFSAELTPFGLMALGQLQLELEQWELADWVAGAPRARLDARAELLPQADAPNFTLAGSVSVRNTSPGPLNRGLLPVRAARGQLVWSADQLVIEVRELNGTRGQASGRLEWQPGGALGASAKVSGIDAASLWAGLAATDASGELQYSLAEGRQRLTGQLFNRGALPLSARVDLALSGQELRIAPSELRLGAGQAQLQGQIQLERPHRARLSAQLRELDLAQLVPGVATQLSGELDFDGQLSANPSGTARLALSNSVVFGRPLSGKASATLQDKKLEASAELNSRSTRLSARGGLGEGRSLEIELSAPALGELWPELAGRVQAELRLSGDWDAPQFVLHSNAEQLRLPGGHTVAQLALNSHGTLNTTTPFEFSAELNQHHAPTGDDASLATARLEARGTLGQQNLSLTARTQSDHPISAAARGGWHDQAWRGELLNAQVAVPTPFTLSQPARLVLGAKEQSLGPAEFSLAGARFWAVSFSRDASGTRTTGRFEGLRPQSLDPGRREFRRATRVGQRNPLSLRGQWDLAAAPLLSGSLQIERASGDLYAGVAAIAPLGLSQLGLKLEASSGRIHGDFRVAGSTLGQASGRLDAWADTAGTWRLAQDRPLQIDLDADIATLGWLGPLINDNVQIEGRAKAKVEVRGTPADPHARGSASADALRLAWVDQGLRLENGSATAELEDGVLVLKNLEFTGPPRVKPELEAAAAGIPAGPGSVRAFGRLALATFSGAFAIKAERLPVLQLPDRWIVASGEAGLALYGQRAELSAKLVADGAYIDFNKFERGPSLPDDVVVVRSGRDRPAPAKPPIALSLNATADLGPRFYIRGGGVESRLEGRIEVKGQAGALRALGSVQTVAGTYSGYGQRLRIERGIVTFQGRLDNPALNVLALRPSLPVSVGVAITGTALRPVVRLYSDPSMPEAEKLNWLVLGRPADGSGQDRAMLAAAAGALFAGQSDAATSTLMRNLGLDEISLRGSQSNSSLLPRETVAGQLRSSSSATQEVVALGKRINDKLYLSFEQAITGSSYAVALSYQLTQALSVVGRAGTTNAIDLVWTVAFD